MTTIGFIGITILFLYVVLIIFLILGFYRVGEETYKTSDPKNSFSIVIPFRNEEDNLEALIESLAKIEYPSSKFEVIFVDDNSTDNSYELCKTLVRFTKLKTKIVRLDENHVGKKQALVRGIEEAIFDYIITTDADCTVQELWLKIFDQSLVANKSKMIAGPVNYSEVQKGFFESFQTADLAAMIGTTIGSFGLKRPIMCNGANLLFSKDAFYDVGGYEGNMDSVSGDDVFLLEKFSKRFPNDVEYLKSEYSIVSTNTLKNLKDLLAQRVRWASKASSYTNWPLKLLSIFIALVNVTILFLMVYLIFYPEPRILLFIVMKFLVDLWIIWISSNFLSQKQQVFWYPLVAVSYPLYVMIVAVLSQTKIFVWKNRKFKKNNSTPINN